jgi:hypothetical protein
MTADITADPELMRAGAGQLSELADELIALAGRMTAVRVLDPRVSRRRDELAGTLRGQAGALVLAAEQVYGHATELDEQERRAARWFR